MAGSGVIGRNRIAVGRVGVGIGCADVVIGSLRGILLAFVGLRIACLLGARRIVGLFGIRRIGRIARAGIAGAGMRSLELSIRSRA